MSLYQKASLVQIPSGYKAADDKLYSVVPNNGDGDFTVTVDADATRVNKDGLVETVAADQARLNYDPTNPQDPHLLLEPSRTNKQIYSQELSNSAYLKVGSTVTADQTTAPDGTLTADKVQRNTTSASYLRDDIYESTNGYYYSSSFFIKKGNCDRVAFRLQTNYPDRYDVRFVFSTENVEYNATAGDMTNGSYNIVKYNNGWYRIELTAKTASDNTAIVPMLSPRVSAGNVDSSDTSSDAFCYSWGWQTETSGNTSSSYATSYIPTLSNAEVTRTVDSAHLLNQTLFTDYPFTVYANAKVDNFSNVAFSLIDSTASNKYLCVQFTSSSQIGVLRRDASSNDSDYYSFSYSIGDTLKIAISYVNNTSYKLYVNGTELADITSGASIPFNHNDISLGQFRIAGDTGTRNGINEFMVFNEALSDSELQTLTS
jgi:hypothetical protein